MKKTINIQLKATLLGFVFVMVPGVPLLADDTEIFFGGAQPNAKTIPPNILFMLDTSGSMNQTDGTNPSKSRLDRMKDALEKIFTDKDSNGSFTLNNVNVGLGRYTVPGGAILFPVKPIDEKISKFMKGDERKAIDEVCKNLLPDWPGSKPTVREVLRCLVKQMSAQGNTPIVGSMYEAALYLRGDDVKWGRTRGNENFKEFRRVSHPVSYTGGIVEVEGNKGDQSCTYSDSFDDPNDPTDDNDLDCRTENITGSPIYISPITDSCQRTHLVMLSDGAPTYNDSVDLIEPLLRKELGDTNINCSNPPGSGSDDVCAWELARFLATADQIPVLTDDQTINTHTIGFNFNNSSNPVSQDAQDWFRAIAEGDRNTPKDEGGKGIFRTADSAAELVGAFQEIINKAIDTDTSFVAPSAAVNQFNRLSNRDELYFALFKPDSQPRWPGNVKQYKLGPDPTDPNSIVILDNSSPPIAAVETSSGQFKDSAVSFWGSITDGNNVELGGVADRLRQANRNIYTYTGNYPLTGPVDLSDATNKLDEFNAAITDAMLLGITSPTASDTSPPYNKTLTLQWARGIDVNDPNNSSSTLVDRTQIGDPLHSQPVLITYGGSESNPDITLFFGTNEGALHAINTATGAELFAFYPQELLRNLDSLRRNVSNQNHIYGLDGSITPWVKDGNVINTIDGDDHVFLYIGMRRGDKNYYALDVTNRDTPKLKWVIKGGEGDFTELGQTWSKPVLTTIEYKGNPTTVLIFGGGYDDVNQDSVTVTTRTPDTVGRAIYIVDAKTGQKLWSGGSSNSIPAHDTIFNKPGFEMDYSIPSEIRVIDVDNNGKADKMFVGDMGGRIWRFDILPHPSGTSANALVQGGIIADLNDGTATGNRRFYSPPDLAIIKNFDGTRFMSIAIGSGWRAHPLNTVVKDRLYMIRNTNIFGTPDYSTINVIKESNLFPATSNIIGQGTGTPQTTAINSLAAANGWFIKLENTGEKALAPSLTLDSQILFTTFEPGTSASSCQAAIGTGRLYAVNAVDATPISQLAVDPDNPIKSDRVNILDRGGIPPGATSPIINGKPQIVIGTELVDNVPLDTVKKVYWRPVE